MDINKELLAAFTIKKQFIQEEDWDKLADCLYNVFKDLYDYKVLTAKPVKVTAGYRAAEENTERFEVKMIFDECPIDIEKFKDLKEN